MAKYASRFDNFFLNLRLNRAQFGDMAGFTLQALRQSPDAARYDELSKELELALTAYAAAHTGQLSGEDQGATVTVGQALGDFTAFVKRVERKHVIPNYEENSADVKSIFPKGRSGLTGSSQALVLDAFGAFLLTLAARPNAFPAAVRAEGQQVYKALKAALELADGTQAGAATHRTDLHDGREATCRQLFRAYATLLLAHFESPQRVAGYFDLSKAFVGGSKGKKAELPATA
ncbi:hypothetical protein [Hymenobacter chitinivorans]|uniref:Uncharacterized protein n=1 Tax=Hymenobacter chitinivorans DSM 11115 TaxID=1121954 RepID=A0A2M9BPF3_9BACT|nr:hypothetical protein [Hymenobacter chitinivorans]PJJ59802.1 hypothetical protein CLV45_1224 [Hymenobacter chitinivorans DSM 11115]